jgi:hypothetical protein
VTHESMRSGTELIRESADNTEVCTSKSDTLVMTLGPARQVCVFAHQENCQIGHSSKIPSFLGLAYCHSYRCTTPSSHRFPISHPIRTLLLFYVRITARYPPTSSVLQPVSEKTASSTFIMRGNSDMSAGLSATSEFIDISSWDVQKMWSIPG